MSAATGTILTLIGTGVTAGTTIGAFKSASGASRRATDVSARANADALELDKADLAEQKRQFDEQQRLAKQAFDAEEDSRKRTEMLDEARYQNDNARATRGENVERHRYNANAPYRATGRAATLDLANRAGLTVGPEDLLPMVEGGEAPPYPTKADIDAEIAKDRRATDDPAPGPDGLIEVRLPLEDYRALNPDLPSAPPIARRPRMSLASLGQTRIARPRGKAA